MTETGTHERKNDSTGVTQVEVTVQEVGHDINVVTSSVTGNSANTSKTKVTGQK